MNMLVNGADRVVSTVFAGRGSLRRRDDDTSRGGVPLVAPPVSAVEVPRHAAVAA
jgi:hypothetical protein